MLVRGFNVTRDTARREVPRRAAGIISEIALRSAATKLETAEVTLFFMFETSATVVMCCCC